MKFSLVMATLGRSKGIAEFCESLLKQNVEYELIIVDQNTDGRLDDICKTYSKRMNLKHIKSSVRGLSINRNIGLEIATGNYVGFPDDDCIYNEGTLKRAQEYLKQYDFVSFNVRDFNDMTVSPLFSEVKRDINAKHFMDDGFSSSIFALKDKIEEFRFDEQLGVGARFGSGEESDFILYMLNKGLHGYYDGLFYIGHPRMDYEAIRKNDKRTYNYALGLGALYKKWVVYEQYYSLLPQYLAKVLKAFAGIFIRDHHMYWLVLKGRIEGFARYER